ncbi:MAG: sensor histidine kinase [Chitinophagaceae bacterium]
MKNRDTIKDKFAFTTRSFDVKKFWVLAFGVYVLVETTYWVLHYINIFVFRNCDTCSQPVFYYVLQWMINLALTGLVWYCLNSFYHKNRFLIIVLNVVVFILHYAGWIAINYSLQRSGTDWMIGQRTQSVNNLIYFSWFDIGKYVFKITVFYVMKFYSEYRRSEEQRVQLAVVNKDMQLNLLKQQLSPHFYFNTLNNLYGLARSNNGKLSIALQQLSNIMQYVIVECNQPKVSLQKEIDFLQSYIALEKLRYEENTIIDMAVEGKPNGQTILPLMLIQLVENAFKHGMKEKSEQNWMKVVMRIHNSELLFSVDNSFYTSQPAEGIGLSSVKHNLNLQYDGKYDMKMNAEDGKFSVKLQLNLS